MNAAGVRGLDKKPLLPSLELPGSLPYSGYDRSPFVSSTPSSVSFCVSDAVAVSVCSVTSVSSAKAGVVKYFVSCI